MPDEPMTLSEEVARGAADCPDPYADLAEARKTIASQSARIAALTEALAVPKVWTPEERDGMAAAYLTKGRGHYESLFAAAAWLLRKRTALSQPAPGSGEEG